jgi:hypothetical protein
MLLLARGCGRTAPANWLEKGRALGAAAIAAITGGWTDAFAR